MIVVIGKEKGLVLFTNFLKEKVELGEEKIEKLENVEKVEKLEKLEKIEKNEKNPELEKFPIHSQKTFSGFEQTSKFHECGFSSFQATIPNLPSRWKKKIIKPKFQALTTLNQNLLIRAIQTQFPLTICISNSME